MSSGRIPMGPGGEFDLIRRLLGPGGPLPEGVEVGPGDDGLVLEGGWVVSTDLLVEGVHFHREWISPHEAGYRGAAAALSDLAAMAAQPVAALLALAVGPAEGRPGWGAAETPGDVAARIQEGAAEACRLAGAQILGGDLSRSSGPLALCVTVLGRSAAPILRRGLQPGDELWVTGRLGGSAGAVELWTQGRQPGPALREAFVRPRPRIREALWLSGRVGLHGLIDLSDGLAGDAGHLAAASGVSLTLHEDRIPVHPGLTGDEAGGLDPMRLALEGGEDYELCLAAPSGALDEWTARFQDSFGIPLTKVGRVTEGEGVFLQRADGEKASLSAGGFTHFSSEETG